MKNWFIKNQKKLRVIIKILIFILVMGWMFGFFNNYSNIEVNLDKKIGKWFYDVPIENGKIIKDDISLSYIWLNGRKVIKDKRFSLINELPNKEFYEDKGFAFAIISFSNSGRKSESIMVGGLSSEDSNGDTYYPYSSIDPTQQIESIFDEKGEKIIVFSGEGVMDISVSPGMIEKRAILFEFPLDSKSADLKIRYK